MRFRPLTGILFFNGKIGAPFGRRRLEVSVPLRGFCFSTRGGSQSKACILERGFRPLTGILFFNSLRNWNGYKLKDVCFRPLTGILFFNTRLR